MNKIVKNALILAAITLIAGLLLGAAHQVTLEPIQKQQEKEKQESCQNVFPEAVSFEEVTMSDAEQAARMEPNNMEYQQLLSRLKSGGATYQQYGGGSPVVCGTSNICVDLCIANMLCGMCCRPC